MFVLDISNVRMESSLLLLRIRETCSYNEISLVLKT